MSRILRVILWGALAVTILGAPAPAQSNGASKAAAVRDHQGRGHR